MAQTKTKSRTPSRKTSKTPNCQAPSNQMEVELSPILADQFRELRLPSFRDHFHSSAEKAAVENLSHLEYLAELTNLEIEARRVGQIRRLMTRSKLPAGKT